VQRIQTAVVSGALCLFWSQQDTSGRLVGTCQGQ